MPAYKAGCSRQIAPSATPHVDLGRGDASEAVFLKLQRLPDTGRSRLHSLRILDRSGAFAATVTESSRLYRRAPVRSNLAHSARGFLGARWAQPASSTQGQPPWTIQAIVPEDQKQPPGKRRA